MVLTTAQKARITLLITNLEKGSAGKASIDDVVAVALNDIFKGQGDFPTNGKRPFYSSLRESPVSTLLRALLNAAA